MKNACKLLVLFTVMGSAQIKMADNAILEKEKARVLERATAYLDALPVTVTAWVSERSAGGKNDFYSEGDYWWPDPDNPEGPYIRRDGMTNPDNFTAHRHAMVRLSQIAGALGSAYKVSKDVAFAQKLVPHLRAWFIDGETMMNPSLKYAQAIKGRVTGRGIGIIDTIHLLEVVKAIMAIEDAKVLSAAEIVALKKWFSDYLKWINTHPYGIAERSTKNNHAACWTLQAAVFAEFTENEVMLNYAAQKFKEELLPLQMARNGSFPRELDRTKPYGYSLFNLDVMAGIAQVLSNERQQLFKYSVKGRSLEKGMEFLYPYIKHKDSWPYGKDVLYWEEWPVRHPSLLFVGLALGNRDYLELWGGLEADFDNPEVVRNMPIRHPLLWLN
ncbi:alginate lyase family protein [Maribacter sp. 2307ULW6-5]|uniref:alginate lyase family protein n=1 Tax=Maribacter sp. 2307ULW6-5 TaxID=3386275 RepID=UPI0039BD7D96